MNIHEALGTAIRAKIKLVPAYRKNLAPAAQVWLLLYSSVSVSRGMPIPHGINDSRFEFNFDKIFWFFCLGNKFTKVRNSASRS
jgi:hypothetical protein